MNGKIKMYLGILNIFNLFLIFLKVNILSNSLFLIIFYFYIYFKKNK